MPKNHSFTNIQIAKLLRSVSAALVLSKGDNRFRIIAYDRAADSIEHATSEIKDLWDENKLGEIAGIGESIATHLDELFRTGRVKHFESLLKPIPPAVFELMDIPGLGPKNALKLCKALGISKSHTAISKLEKAAQQGQVADIEGFGVESQANILKNIEVYKNRSGRILLNSAHAIVDSLMQWMKKLPSVNQIEYLGSLRRQAATIGDLDLAVSTVAPLEVLKHFTAYPKSQRTLESGEHSASILVPGNIQIDLMVQEPDSFGSLLQHFTGSKHHNVALREYALKQGYSLSEYGIKTSHGLKKFASEVDFYNFLGMDWIPPQLREGKGEIEAAINHNLPKLIEQSDLKGDLHMHTDFEVETSHDLGKNSLPEMIESARRMGYEYIGITEHNPSVSGHTAKQMAEILKRKQAYVHNNSGDFTVFNGLEIDIQPNGSLAVADECLDLLDYAIVSVHSSFNQDKKTATSRVIRALEHPKVKIFGHPTGRILNEREGLDYDWDTIFDYCVKHDKWLEIDSWPNRLDLPDILVHEAVKHGVKIVIDTDSHDSDSLEFIKFGVGVAKRGWVEPSMVINTKSKKDISLALNLPKDIK